MCDLITNSSSEVFVGNSGKTLEATKELITKVCAPYYEVVYDKSFNWDEVFGKMIISEYDVHEPIPFCMNSNSSFSRRVEDARKDFERSNPRPCYPNKPTEKEKDEFFEKNLIFNDKCEEYLDQVFKSERDEARQSIEEFYSKVFKKNGLDFSEIKDKSIKFHYSNCPSYFFEETENELLNLIDLYLDYGVNVSKGDILLYSESDNTVPYELFEMINHILYGTNYHLG